MGTKTAEKQAEIAALESEIEQLRQDLIQIEQQIADNWNGDNGEAEASYALKQARLNASGRVLERLQSELASAAKTELLAEYRQWCEEAAPLEKKEAQAQKQVLDLREQTKQAEKALGEAMEKAGWATRRINLHIPSGRSSDPANRFEEKGITQGELDGIRQEVYSKYRVKE